MILLDPTGPGRNPDPGCAYETVRPDRVAVPYLDATVMVTEPVVDLGGTVTTICPAVFELTEAFLLPTVTFLAEPRPEPWMTSVPPRLTVAGENEVIDGPRWKIAELVAVPDRVVTLMEPSAAPAGRWQ